MPLQVLSIVRDLRKLVRLDVIQRRGKPHLTEAVVVAIGLAVRSDVD